MRAGSAPTATQLRTASSMALAAMWYGIEIAVAGIHAAGEHQSAVRTQHRAQHRGVARTVIGDADQRLDHTAALHFVIVLANHPFLAGHVERSQDAQQVAVEILRAGCRRTTARPRRGVKWASRTTGGRPPCRNFMSRSATSWP